MAFLLPIDAETVNSSSYVSDGISLHKNSNGFSLYYSVSGSGSVDFFVHTSPDGYNFVKQTRALKRGVTAGTNMFQVPIIPCDAFKIEATETAGSATTVTAKINMLPGQFGEFPVYDGVTDAVKTIAYEHHEIHAGDHYFVRGYQDLAITNVLDMTFLTPNTTKWVHWIWEIATESETNWLVYEGASVTNALTTTVTIRNSNRNSANTSGVVLKYEKQADLATANADTNVGSAILLSSGISGAGKDAGRAERTNEMIMKQNTLYCLRAIATAAGYINFTMEWYEHRNR